MFIKLTDAIKNINKYTHDKYSATMVIKKIKDKYFLGLELIDIKSLKK